MKEFIEMFDSEGTIIAAVVTLIGVLVAEWLNRKKFKVDMQQMTNEFHQQRETETEWGKQVDEIAIMQKSEMNEKTLLIVRNLLGAMQGSYKDSNTDSNPNTDSDPNTDKEANPKNKNGFTVERQEYKIGFLTALNDAEQKVDTLDYYVNFKNYAIDYVEFLQKRYLIDGIDFSYFTETEAENLRMICRVLKQDRWITKDITGKTSYLVNEFSFFSRINEAEVQFFKEKSTFKVRFNVAMIALFTILALAFTICSHFNGIFTSLTCILIFLVGIIIFIRYITFNTVLMERQDYIDRKEAQQIAAGKKLKDELKAKKAKEEADKKAKEEQKTNAILSKLQELVWHRN